MPKSSHLLRSEWERANTHETEKHSASKASCFGKIWHQTTVTTEESAEKSTRTVSERCEICIPGRILLDWGNASKSGSIF